ncbi:MAG: hypothetical protein LBR11_11420 [Deltaproteobacteria bacterium]|jgi:hypothetical protein|nr:hypothetical protein [Deltaproteobacteria bacterium]
MFHSSYQSNNYKLWLIITIKWLNTLKDNNKPIYNHIFYEDYFNFLNQLAYALFLKDCYFKNKDYISINEINNINYNYNFINDNLLTKDNKILLEELYLDLNFIEFINSPINNNSILEEIKINLNSRSYSYIFNYLDYLFWLSAKKYNLDITNFYFTTFRSSVDYFDPISDHSISDDILDYFGNLSIMTDSLNSSLGNIKPT